jgi:DNA-binding NarL/FixJ family response regulator
MTAVAHDPAALVTEADQTHFTSPPLLVTVVCHADIGAPSLAPLHPRITNDVSTVRASDNVVVLCSRRPAADVIHLRQTLGRNMPAVLVAAREFDAEQVATAFEHGATSYLVLSETPQSSLVSATIATARRETCLSPDAAAALRRHLHVASLPDPSETARITDLTRGERQIMELLVAGCDIREIARHLTVTGKTVRNRLSKIYAKLNVRRQPEAILWWLRHTS